MNIIVHIMLSCSVRKRLKKELGIKLNLRGFVLGNILPDINRRLHKQRHFMKDSLPFILNRVDQLKLASEKGVKPDSYHFSKSFGIINHYLSDFFCYAHQDGYDKGLKAHMLFELGMIPRYRKGTKRYKKYHSGATPAINPNECKEWIKNNNEAYSLQSGTAAHDIRYAIHAGSVIGKSLIAFE